MVRETRFAFDDDFDDPHPPAEEDFTDEDDRFLDTFSHPEDPEPGGESRSSSQIPKQPHQSRSKTKKPLSDADWLSPQRPPDARRRKSA